MPRLAAAAASPGCSRTARSVARRRPRPLARPSSSGGQQALGLRVPVGQVVQVAQQPVGRLAVGAHDEPLRPPARRRQGARGVQGGPRLGLGDGPRLGGGERLRHGHQAAGDRGHALGQPQGQGIVRRRGRHQPQLEAVGVATELEVARPGQPADPCPQRLSRLARVGLARAALAGHQHDPWRAGRGEPFRAAGRRTRGRGRHVAKGERQQRPDAAGDRPLQLGDRFGPQQDQGGRAGQRRAQGDRPGVGQVPRGGSGRRRRAGRGVHGQHLPGGAFQGHGTPHERGDRAGEGVGPGAGQGQALEVGLQGPGLPVELGARVDEVADDRPLQALRVAAGQPQDGQAHGARLARHGRGGRARLRSLPGTDQQERARPGGAHQRGQRVARLHLRREQVERRLGHDGQVAGLERVEGRRAGLHDPDPGDRRDERRPDPAGASRTAVGKIASCSSPSVGTLRSARAPGRRPTGRRGRRAAGRTPARPARSGRPAWRPAPVPRRTAPRPAAAGSRRSGSAR